MYPETTIWHTNTLPPLRQIPALTTVKSFLLIAEVWRSPSLVTHSTYQ
ncbi:hypothetical protein [Okeania sp. SIO2C9]|nr:hypothetical protein [Okeania sp. SIO2C9]